MNIIFCWSHMKVGQLDLQLQDNDTWILASKGLN
jgi:hypothetical protein